MNGFQNTGFRTLVSEHWFQKSPHQHWASCHIVMKHDQRSNQPTSRSHKELVEPANDVQPSQKPELMVQMRPRNRGQETAAKT
ncbi:MAG: hypothetical protein CMM05_05645 [Rhodopirellula sp.]|nr:hypothetical protein [Rhodopirellula sp.]